MTFMRLTFNPINLMATLPCLLPIFVSGFFIATVEAGMQAEPLPRQEVIAPDEIPPKEIEERLEGSDFRVVLKKDGSLWGWGKNHHH